MEEGQMSEYVDPFPGRPNRSPADADPQDRTEQVAEWPDAGFEDLVAEVEELHRTDLEEIA
jgi:hypothetical protein